MSIQRRMQIGSKRRGFTLVEMLVVISIIGLLASLLMPAISKSREAARTTQCSSNLKDFGIGMMLRSTRMPDKAFCTGNFDLLHDGVPTEIGWVADLVQTVGLTGEMMCASSECRTSAAVEQMLTLPVSDFGVSPCVDRLGSKPFQSDTGYLVSNIARQIVANGIAPETQERADLIDQLMLQEGFNTNYAASWFLVRGGLELDISGNPQPKSGCANLDPLGRNVTEGPLTMRALGTSRAPSSTIPLLCDAWPAGITSGTIGDNPGGTLYARSLVGGPIGNTPQIDSDANGSLDTPSPYYLQQPSFPRGHPRTGTSGWLKAWSHDTRQDYRGMAALHSGVANVLMADGSVQKLADNNGDGFINNGFAPPPATSTTTTAGTFWESSDVEADQLTLASYYSIYSKGE
ncbi:MAG: DUF1559 domain-containing protein [Pirellulaceae bacterium]